MRYATNRGRAQMGLKAWKSICVISARIAVILKNIRYFCFVECWHEFQVELERTDPLTDQKNTKWALISVDISKIIAFRQSLNEDSTINPEWCIIETQYTIYNIRYKYEEFKKLRASVKLPILN